MVHGGVGEGSAFGAFLPGWAVLGAVHLRPLLKAFLSIAQSGLTQSCEDGPETSAVPFS